MERRAVVRAWLLVGWAALVVGMLALNVIWPLPGQEGARGWMAGLMAYPVAAALLLVRRPGNAIGRTLAVVGAAAGAIALLSWYAATFPDAPGARQGESLASGAAIAHFAGLIVLVHLFPTGRPVHRWHVRALAVFAVYILVMAAIGLTLPGPMPVTGRANPFGVAPASLRPVFDAGFIGLPVFVLAGLVTLWTRSRGAGPVERAQLRWFAAGGVAMLALFVAVTLFPDDTGLLLLEVALVVVAFWSLPVAVVIAVVRYRLYEIDRVISRTVSYAVIAGALAAVYVGVLLALQAVLPIEGSEFAVAASTLAAAALFAPLRRQVRARLDRRFDRARYEADQVIQRFAAGLRREVDLDALTDGLRDVVVSTLQPASVRLWLRSPVGPGSAASAEQD